MSSYVSNGVTLQSTPAINTPPLPVVSGRWTTFAYTYQRVGGAGDNIATLYINGAVAGVTSTAVLVQALAGKWSSNGYTGASVGSACAIRGLLVTYKVLSGADIARINAAVSP
jgi:hypothetical protein